MNHFIPLETRNRVALPEEIATRFNGVVHITIDKYGLRLMSDEELSGLHEAFKKLPKEKQKKHRSMLVNTEKCKIFRGTFYIPNTLLQRVFPNETGELCLVMRDDKVLLTKKENEDDRV